MRPRLRASMRIRSFPILAALILVGQWTIPVQASAELSYVSGGFAASGGGGEGTIGYGWVDDSGRVVGHITVDHLVRGAKSVSFVETSNFAEPTYKTVPVIGTTDDVDVGVIAPVADVLEPVVELADGTRLTVTNYARAGSIVEGQQVCHSGQNEVTATLHEICGQVISVGATSGCKADNGSSTCAVEIKSNREDGYPGGLGDSGSAAYTYNSNGTITVVGTYKAAGSGTGVFEPTYAAMDVFEGHPLTIHDVG